MILAKQHNALVLLMKTLMTKKQELKKWMNGGEVPSHIDIH